MLGPFELALLPLLALLFPSPPPPVPPRCARSRRPPTPPPTPTPAPYPTFFDDVVDKYGWDTDAEVQSRWCGPTDGAVDWGRSDAPTVEEVVGPDGVDFVAGDDALAFGSGVTDLNMAGPLELVVSNGAGEGLAELELLSCLLTI
ncbi:hypothetical protein TRIUR3_21468 [Triticum urartu]|uniref:Uncharacterized protein n=1 Tax=Triticum urartu TaxID=4572 RepID=M7Y653_TRIUA|nr:hypothetical protein TRIUR3_21468 [Triticum urartu]